MNLKDILEYRENCVHCDRPLVMHIDGYPKLSIEKTDKGLSIKSDKPNGVFLNFNYDGSYERNKRTYEIHKRVIYVRKYCHFHMPHLKEFVGTSINDIKEKSCCVYFTVQGSADGTYTANMEYEGICWHDDVEFWALDTFYWDDVTHIYRGEYLKKISDMLHLKLPIMNLSNVKTQEQWLNKLKLYALFS